MPRITNLKIALQSNTENTYYATWSFNESARKSLSKEAMPKAKSYLDHYQVKWYYATGDGVAFLSSTSEEKVKQSTYNPPSNATGIKVYVRPIAKKHKVNGKDVAYWTASGVTKYLSLYGSPPEKPSTPTVEIENYKLTAMLDIE